MNNKKYAVISLSGGMDSSTLLLRLLNEGYNVTAISFDYGQKHKIELDKAKELVEYLNGHSQHGDEQYYNKIKHKVITLVGLSQLLNSTLVEGGKEVPEGHYADSNMQETVVPNRNKIFSSIIQAVALSIANDNNCECIIALGVHSGDHTIYPDCTENFRNADEYAFKIGNWNSELVNYYTPYMEGNKFTILQDGEKLCKELELDFDEVYKRTNTSYKPIYIPYPESTSRVEEAHRTKFGEWYSDYKSASSVERVEAFLKLGRPDPVSYADETGPVSWDIVVEYVNHILKNHQN